MLYFGACALGRPACVQLMLQAALGLQACVERGWVFQPLIQVSWDAARAHNTFWGRCISAVLRLVLWGLYGRLDAASLSIELAILTSQPV